MNKKGCGLDEGLEWFGGKGNTPSKNSGKHSMRNGSGHVSGAVQSEPAPSMKGEPPREVMNKLQHQLEKVQKDIQAQQRQGQRQHGSRFRPDSRRPSDSDRYAGRLNSGGFRPYPRQVHRMRPTDTGSCPPWGQLAMPRPQQDWPGVRAQKMAVSVPPRSTSGHADRMPQPNRAPLFKVFNEQPRKFHPRPDTHISTAIPSPQGHTHLSESQLQLFPPLLNPYAGQRQVFGRMVQSGAQQQTNVWHRPALGHVSSHSSAERNEKSAPRHAYPCTTQSLQSWRRNGAENTGDPHEAISKNTLQSVETRNNTTAQHVYGRSYKNSQDGETENSATNVKDGWHNCDQKVSDTMCSKSVRPTKSGQNGTVNTSNGSPPRKDRSSSGPQTPPGLRCDETYDSATGLKNRFGVHNLLLANIPLKLAGEKDVLDDPFEDSDKDGQKIRIKKLLQPTNTKVLEDKEKDKEFDNNEKTLQTISKMMILAQAQRSRSDLLNLESLDAIVATLTSLSPVVEKISQEDQVRLTKALQLFKMPGHQHLDTIASELQSVQCNKRKAERHTEDMYDLIPPKIFQRDLNNNMSCQCPRIIQKQFHKSLPERHIAPVSMQNLGNSGENKTTQKRTPVAFVTPFSYSAYQPRSAKKANGRNLVKTTTPLTPRDTTCPKCHNRLKWPHLLVCCHRFCFPCLVAMFDKENMKIQCPYCRSITPTDNSLTTLVLDLHRCREMCSIQISPFVCTHCSENKHADTVCKTCPGFLCGDCQIKHKTVPEWSSHELRYVQKVGYNAEGELHPMCPDHPGMLFNQFCVCCSVMVCTDCTEENHVSHETCDLAAGKQIAEGKFREMNCGLVEMIELCQKKLQNFNLSKQKIEATMKVVRNNIHKACNQVIDYIEIFEKMSKSLTIKVHAAGVKHVNSLLKEANGYEEERATFEAFCKSYIEDSKPEELTAVLPLVYPKLQRLKEFYSKPSLIDPSFSVELTFDPIYPDFNEAMSRMFAGLQFEHNVTLEALLNSPLGERAILESAQPQPFDMVFPSAGETISGERSSGYESSSRSSSGCDVLKHFLRQTTPYKYMFGKYGRGDYEFAEPSGICYLHDDSLAVCDAKNHRVVVFDEACSFLKTIGQPPNLPPLPPTVNSSDSDHSFSRTPGTLYFPFRLAQCPVTQNLVIVERPPSTDIQVFNFDGSFLRCFGHDCLRYPRGITVDESGHILVVESRTMKVFIFSMAGVKLQAFYLSMHLEFPNDIVAKEGNIFVSDNRTHCVHVYDYNLEWQRQIGNESLTYFPIGVALNHLGHVVVADNHNTFNITVFGKDGGFIHGFKSQSKHANCYSVAVHPRKAELAVTTKECRVVLFDYTICERHAVGNLEHLI